MKGRVTKTGYRRNSPDVNNDYNVIPSNRISMAGVDFPVLGIDNLGNSELMYPGGEYEFQGDYVTELPAYGSGGLTQWFAEKWVDIKTGKKRINYNHKRAQFGGGSGDVFQEVDTYIKPGQKIRPNWAQTPNAVTNYTFGKNLIDDESRFSLGLQGTDIFDEIKYRADAIGSVGVGLGNRKGKGFRPAGENLRAGLRGQASWQGIPGNVIENMLGRRSGLDWRGSVESEAGVSYANGAVRPYMSIMPQTNVFLNDNLSLGIGYEMRGRYDKNFNQPLSGNTDTGTRAPVSQRDAYSGMGRGAGRLSLNYDLGNGDFIEGYYAKPNTLYQGSMPGIPKVMALESEGPRFGVRLRKSFKKGGQLPKAQEGIKVKPASRRIRYEDGRIKLQDPAIYDGMLDEVTVTPYTQSELAWQESRANLATGGLEPVYPIFDVMTLGLRTPATAGAKAIQAGIKKAPSKINPRYFQPNSNMYYRGIGREGMEDALESGLFRAKPSDKIPARMVDLGPNLGKLDMAKRFNKTYYSPRFNIADQYGAGYIAEVPKDAAKFSKRYKNTDWSMSTRDQIPVSEGQILKKDWWSGYKPIKGSADNLSGIGKIARGYNKIATGNSALPIAWKVEKSVVPKSSQYINGPYTKAQSELLADYGRGMDLTPQQWSTLEEFTKSGATQFSGDFPISRVLGYYTGPTAETQAISNLRLGQTFSTPAEKTIRTWSAGLPSGGVVPENATRLVIPSRYTKNLGNNFAGMNYGDKANNFIWGAGDDGMKILNAAAVGEKELMGNLPKGFRVIGKSTEQGLNNIFIKPIKEYGGSLYEAQEGIEVGNRFLPPAIRNMQPKEDPIYYDGIVGETTVTAPRYKGPQIRRLLPGEGDPINSSESFIGADKSGGLSALRGLGKGIAKGAKWVAGVKSPVRNTVISPYSAKLDKTLYAPQKVYGRGMPNMDAEMTMRGELIEQYNARNNAYHTVNITDEIRNNEYLRNRARTYGYNPDSDRDLALFLGTSPGGVGRRTGYENILPEGFDFLYSGNNPIQTFSRYGQFGDNVAPFTTKFKLFNDNSSMLSDRQLFERIQGLDGVNTYRPDLGIKTLKKSEDLSDMVQGQIINTNSLHVPGLNQTNIMVGRKNIPVRDPIDIRSAREMSEWPSVYELGDGRGQFKNPADYDFYFKQDGGSLSQYQTGRQVGPPSLTPGPIQDKVYPMITGPVEDSLENRIINSPPAKSKKQVVSSTNGVNVDPDRLRKGIKYAESLNGKLMMNPESTATGFYGQLFSEVKGKQFLKNIDRETFAADTALQNKVFEERLKGNEELFGIKKGLIDNGIDIYNEYKPILKDKLKYSPTELAALSNMLGRQGAREYVGYVLRDGKTLAEALPNIYGPDAKYKNHTPEEYIEKFNKAFDSGKSNISPSNDNVKMDMSIYDYQEGGESIPSFDIYDTYKRAWLAARKKLGPNKKFMYQGIEESTSM